MKNITRWLPLLLVPLLLLAGCQATVAADSGLKEGWADARPEKVTVGGRIIRWPILR